MNFFSLLNPSFSLYAIDIYIPPSESPIRQLIDHVYPDMASVHMLPEKDRQMYFSERAILASPNTNVDEINDECIEHLTGESRTYLSVDSAIDESGI
jgi:hypothetical protein